MRYSCFIGRFYALRVLVAAEPRSRRWTSPVSCDEVILVLVTSPRLAFRDVFRDAALENARYYETGSEYCSGFVPLERQFEDALKRRDHSNYPGATLRFIRPICEPSR